jgi:uncharacterized membrane protein YeiH
MKTMYQDKMVAIICGIGGGMVKIMYFLQTPMSFTEKAFEAGVIAFICGLAGATAKYLFDLIVKQFKTKSNG